MNALVVDDDPVDRALVVRALRRESPGVVVVEARSGAEAVRALRAGVFGLVLVDLVGLGAIHGADVARVALDAGCDVCVVTGATALAPSWARCVDKDALAEGEARLLPTGVGASRWGGWETTEGRGRPTSQATA